MIESTPSALIAYLQELSDDTKVLMQVEALPTDRFESLYGTNPVLLISVKQKYNVPAPVDPVVDNSQEAIDAANAAKNETEA